MKPIITIITVCYNSALLIEETIISILNQINSSIEYIVIDGASTDQTSSILEKYNDKVNLIISEPDDGIYDAMNKGIKHAKGDYLLFINAGDLLCDNSLEMIISNIVEGVDVYYYGYFNMAVVKRKKLLFDGPRCSDLTREIPTCHNAMLISNKAFDKYGLYDTAYKYSADYEWLCRNEDVIKSKNCSGKVVYVLLGGVSEMRNLVVLKEKALIAKQYFGWPNFIKHVMRFIKIMPISFLKQLSIAIGIFDNYLLLKNKFKQP